MKLKSIVQAASKGDLKGCQNYDMYIDGKPIRLFQLNAAKGIIELATEEPQREEYIGPVAEEETEYQAPLDKEGQFELWG